MVTPVTLGKQMSYIKQTHGVEFGAQEIGPSTSDRPLLIGLAV